MFIIVDRELLSAISNLLDEKFDAINKRFDAVEKRMDSLEKRMDLLDRQEKMERDIAVLNRMVSDHSELLLRLAY